MIVVNFNCDDELSVKQVEVVCCIQKLCASYVPFTCSSRYFFCVSRQVLFLSLIWLCVTRITEILTLLLPFDSISLRLESIASTKIGDAQLYNGTLDFKWVA